MATNENPLGIFPFSKEQLETLLVRGTLVDAVRKYRNNAARLLHPDTGGKDFVAYGLPEDGVFKVLNGAFEQIEHADAVQLQQWVNTYGNGGGIPEEQVARILAGAQVLRDQLIAAQGENSDLERRLQDMVRAIGRGQNIPESRLQEMLAGRGGADPAHVRTLETQLADAQRQYQQAHGNLGAAVRDRDAARTEANRYQQEASSEKGVSKRLRDALNGERERSQYFIREAEQAERAVEELRHQRDACQKQATILKQTLKEVRAGILSKTPIGPVLESIVQTYQTTKQPELLAILDKTAAEWMAEGLVESAEQVYAQLAALEPTVERQNAYVQLLRRQKKPIGKVVGESIKRVRDNKEYSRALDLCEALLKSDKGNPDAIYYAGTIYTALRQYGKARAHFSQLPKHTAAQAQLARIEEIVRAQSDKIREARDNREYGKAIALAKALLEVDPQNRDALYYGGTVHVALGEYDQARKYFSQLPKGHTAAQAQLAKIDALRGKK